MTDNTPPPELDSADDRIGGRVAVVTGAASGIGRALAEALVQAGARVVLADVEAGPLAEAAAELATRGEVLAVPTDVSDAAAVEHLRDEAIAAFGRVNIVCNNAGVGGGGPMGDIPLGLWRWVLGVNLFGVIHGVAAFLPHLLSHGDGHIVNTASVAGILSLPNMGPYNVSKHGVVTLSETLHQELTEAGSSLGVTVLCPGFVATRIVESERNLPEPLAADLAAQAPDPERERLRAAVKEIYRQQKPPSEVASLVLQAISARRLYCYTDDRFAEQIADRHRHIEAATNPGLTGQLWQYLLP